MARARLPEDMIDRFDAQTALGALLTALESSALGCTVIVDRDGRFERAYANRPFAEILGLGLEEAMELPPMGLVPAEEQERLIALRDDMESGRRGRLSVETFVVRPDGVSVPVEASLVRVPLDDAHAVFLFLRDLSEREESEQRFREHVLATSLSHTKVSEKPAMGSYRRDITERVDFQAELMRQDRLAAVGTLAAGVAHELNNPLMSLGLQARKLLEDADRHGFSEEVEHALTQMVEAAGRMRTIIADLLFVARPSDIPQTHVDVGEILKSTVALLRAGTPSCPSLREEIEPLPAVQAYPSKLGQVFLNVLRNAVQAVEGKPDAEVVVLGRTTGDSIEIEVVDNGVGIPAEVLPRVTQPFFTTKPKGTGLGLWISQTLMAEHGGRLIVKSVTGRGTTIRLSLPLSPKK